MAQRATKAAASTALKNEVLAAHSIAAHPAQAAIDRASRAVKAGPAKSVAEQASVIPIGAAKINQAQAVAKWQQAKGSALGEMVFKSLADSAKIGKRFVMDVLALDHPQARQAFRSSLDKAKADAINDVAKASEYGFARGLPNSSIGSRLSELKVLSVAMDYGFNVGNCEEMYEATTGVKAKLADIGYTFIIKAARTYKESEASIGNTQRRGRTAMTEEQKFTSYVLRTYTVEHLASLLTQMQKIAKQVKSAADATAMLESLKPTPATPAVA